MTSSKPLPRSAILRLLFALLAAGGLIGAAAAVAPNRATQYALICLAIVVGISAGLYVRAARKAA